MAVADSLAYYDTATITDVKSFITMDTWGLCYKTNTAIIYCNFRLNYRSNFYNIEFTLEWQ
jgi:hypothetical protein